MRSVESIRARRREILEEMGKLDLVRRGSVCEQILRPRARDGRWHECGPYAVYTVKRGGRTVSKRLSFEERDRYREQVSACHRLQALTRELIELGEALCDRSDNKDADKAQPPALLVSGQ